MNKHTAHTRPSLQLRIGVRAGVVAGDRDGDGILDGCVPPFSSQLPGGIATSPLGPIVIRR
jgi:hypothetical protein